MKRFSAKVKVLPANVLIDVGEMDCHSWGTAAQRAINKALRDPLVANRQHTRVEVAIEKCADCFCFEEQTNAT